MGVRQSIDKNISFIKVAIIEDQEKMLASLTLLLNKTKELKVVGAYTSGEEGAKGINMFKPDVALIDLGLPVVSVGIGVIQKLAREVPELKIIVFTVEEDRKHLFSALRAGAAGYLLKDSPFDKIVEAIKEINNGGSFMSPKVARYLTDYFHERKQENNMENTLTEREQEIATYTAEGLTYNEIAEKLFLSPHTVRVHIKNIYEKLHVHSKIEMMMKIRE